jgi:uncharacterized protein involved in response to NO
MAFLDRGFRPFFLFAGLWAIFAVPVWVALYSGVILLPGPLDIFSWHVHALIFGYGAAVVAGFALTAIPNWTGRKPKTGLVLATLALLWLAARFAGVMALLGSTTLMNFAMLDVGFLLAFFVLVGFDIFASRNWRNMPVLLIFGIFILGAFLSHMELMFYSTYWVNGNRLGLAALILLITLIGGRIVPNFTRNWLKGRGAEHLPGEFGDMDKAAIGVTVLALAGWLAGLDGAISVILLLVAAITNLLRLARWRGLATLAEPMVFVMHVSYLWVPLGFLFIALAQLGWINPQAASHAWTIGAVGGMTLAIMTRATLGHSGRAITAGGLTVLCYIAIHLAAILRVMAGVPGEVLAFDSKILIEVSSGLWVAAYLLFLIGYTPLFFRKPG